MNRHVQVHPNTQYTHSVSNEEELAFGAVLLSLQTGFKLNSAAKCNTTKDSLTFSLMRVSMSGSLKMLQVNLFQKLATSAEHVVYVHKLF